MALSQNDDDAAAVVDGFEQGLDELRLRVGCRRNFHGPPKPLEFADGNGSPPSELVPLEHALTHDTMARIIGASRPHTSATLRLLEECDAVRRQSRSGLLVRPSRLRMIVEEGALGDPAFATGLSA